MIDTAKPIEEASLNAWPALRRMVVDGWLVRFSEGYTRRANSVNPLYGGQMAVEDKIRFCEQLYAERQLPCVFKITPFVQPNALDALLDRLGYQKEAPTSVQTLDLATFTSETPVSTLYQQHDPTNLWVETYARMNSVAARNIGPLKAILDHIAPPACYVMLLDNGQPVACGLGVREGDKVGLFDIVTEPSQRGKGLGQQLIAAILAWALNHGAQTAYLQVMLNNAAALRLYEKLGFREIYQYWYRVK
ncbi:MAG: GNAT family N-acetyltransferase [Anaerolineae bacterium]|nr:GNAT family N-acetyltransferase [Anaerolineae bacterium]